MTEEEAFQQAAQSQEDSNWNNIMRLLPYVSVLLPGGPITGMGMTWGANMARSAFDAGMADQRYEDAANGRTGDFANPDGQMGGGEFDPSARGRSRAQGFQSTAEVEDSNYRTRILTPGYEGNLPQSYWSVDENGYETRVRIPAQIRVNYESEGNARWEALTPTQQVQVKQMLYHAGFYPKDYSPITDGLGLTTPEDRLAMANSIYFHEQNPGITYDNMMYQMAAAGSQSGIPYLYGGSAAPTAKELSEQQAIYTTSETAVRQFMAANGIDVSDNFVKKNAAALAEGRIDFDTWQSQVRNDYVANAFPALKDRILAGEDLATIANPYVEAYAKTMGLDSSEVDLANPTIREALQGADASGKPTLKPLWQFQRDLMNTEAFQKTPTYQGGAANFINEFKNMMGM